MNPMSRPEQNFEPGRPDDLDRSIDAALAKYSKITPRPGLEERILANLHAEQNKAPSRTWLYWSIATALTAIVLVSIALMLRSQKSSSVITQRGPANVEPTQPQKTPVHNEIVAIARPVHTPIRRTVAHAEKPLAAAGPKLDQFPSPQPLSAEEIALARYVKNFPKEAQLVADAQEEFELETRKIMNDAGSETPTSNPVQLER
jgi:hypothetical protein